MKPLNPRFGKHLRTLAVAATVAAAQAGTQARATDVGIHFRYIYTYADNSGSIIGSTINTAGPSVYAGIAANRWNNMAPIAYGSGGVPQTGQFLTTPGATGISLDYSAENTYGPYGAATDTNAAYMSYLDDSGVGYSVTLHGLASLGAGYTLTGLQATDTENATFSNILIYSGVGTSGTLLATLAGATGQAFTNGVAGTYGSTIASIVLTSDTITIVGDPRDGDRRSTLAGLAISTVAVPEPSSAVIPAAGAILILFGRNRRKAGQPGHQE